MLLGSFTLEKGGKDQPSKTKRPKGFPLVYVVPPHATDSNKTPKVWTYSHYSWGHIGSVV